MSTYPVDQIFPPPELPSYLKSVNDLKTIVGTPSDEELIGILSVIRAAQKATEIPGMGDYVLLSQLSEHLFDAQMARYRSKYLAATFPENTTYTPPTLPNHVSVHLEPIIGTPSEGDAMKVHDAIRLYQQFSNVPTMFDPHVNMELSQHLFDIQMARHAQRAQQSRTNSTSRDFQTTGVAKGIERIANPAAQPSDSSTNNLGTGANSNTVDLSQPTLVSQDTNIQNAIERSNRLAEQANQLIERSNQLAERSNQIAERSNQLVELSSRPTEQSNNLALRFNELFERLDQHLEQSNKLAKEFTEPVEGIGNVLKNINKVLVGVQHAIIRNHKGNTLGALDCLVNEKGETPAMSLITGHYMFSDFTSDDNYRLSVKIDGILKDTPMSSDFMGKFVRFYDLAGEYFESETSTKLKPGLEVSARNRLGEYLSSCLG